MLECYSTNATVAKIRSMQGNMLTKSDYHEMSNRRSVAEVAEYLKSCPRYHDALTSVDSNTIHRGYLEELLHKSNFDTYIKLINFQRLNEIPFFNFRIWQIEIQQILSFINAMNSHLDNAFANKLPGFILNHSPIDFLALSKCTAPEEMIKVLRPTPYYKVLVKIPPMDNGKLDYTQCEIALRKFYYERLLLCMKRDFSGAVLMDITRLIKTEVDLINLANGYRLKKYFGYSPEQIEKNSLPFTRVGKIKMKSFFASDTPEDMLKFMDKTTYGGKSHTDGDYIETKTSAVRLNMVNHLIETSSSVAVSLYSFMMECDIEVSNIIHIIEGIRYEVEPSYLESKLIVCLDKN